MVTFIRFESFISFLNCYPIFFWIMPWSGLNLGLLRRLLLSEGSIDWIRGWMLTLAFDLFFVSYSNFFVSSLKLFRVINERLLNGVMLTLSFWVVECFWTFWFLIMIIVFFFLNDVWVCCFCAHPRLSPSVLLPKDSSFALSCFELMFFLVASSASWLKKLGVLEVLVPVVLLVVPYPKVASMVADLFRSATILLITSPEMGVPCSLKFLLFESSDDWTGSPRPLRLKSSSSYEPLLYYCSYNSRIVKSSSALQFPMFLDGFCLFAYLSP